MIMKYCSLIVSDYYTVRSLSVYWACKTPILRCIGHLECLKKTLIFIYYSTTAGDVKMTYLTSTSKLKWLFHGLHLSGPYLRYLPSTWHHVRKVLQSGKAIISNVYNCCLGKTVMSDAHSIACYSFQNTPNLHGSISKKALQF